MSRQILARLILSETLRWRNSVGARALLLIPAVIAVISMTVSCAQAQQYKVLVGGIDKHLTVRDLAWVNGNQLYYLTSSEFSSDEPDTLWISADGEARTLYSFIESRLRWDKPCDDPYFYALDAKSGDSIVALVGCDTGSDNQVVAVTSDGVVETLGSARDSHDIAWRRGSDAGAVVLGPPDCHSVAPVVRGVVSLWSSAGPPWSLNDLNDHSACSLRAGLTRVATLAGGKTAFIIQPNALTAGARDGLTPTLYEVDAGGSAVVKLVGGFDYMRDIVSVGDDIVINGVRTGRAGLWRWTRATGAVSAIAKGSFSAIAARPDGGAIGAARVTGHGVEIVQVEL
jgi:hypothetical protein